MSQIKENERLLENSGHGGQSIASKENSKTVMEEDGIRKECNVQWECPTCYREGLGCTLEIGGR